MTVGPFGGSRSRIKLSTPSDCGGSDVAFLGLESAASDGLGPKVVVIKFSALSRNVALPDDLLWIESGEWVGWTTGEAKAVDEVDDKSRGFVEKAEAGLV